MGRNRDASGLPSGWAGREIGRFLHPGIAHAEHELARPNVTGEVMNEAACRSSYRNLAMVCSNQATNLLAGGANGCSADG